MKMLRVTFRGYGNDKPGHPSFGPLLMAPGETIMVEDIPEVHRVIGNSEGAYEIASNETPIGINPKKVRTRDEVQKAHEAGVKETAKAVASAEKSTAKEAAKEKAVELREMSLEQLTAIVEAEGVKTSAKTVDGLAVAIENHRGS